MKILVINFGGIGDEILFLPAIDALKETYPDAKITLALEPRSKSVNLLTDHINDVITVKIKGKRWFFDILKLILKAYNGNYDMVIGSGGNKFISIIMFLTGIKKRYGYDTGRLSRWLLTKAIKLNKNQYAAEMYFDLVKDIVNDNSKKIIPNIKVFEVMKEPNSVLIHPGVSKVSIKKKIQKTLSAEKWAELIDLLSWHGKKVILVGGPDDKEIITKIKRLVHTNNYKDLTQEQMNLYDLAVLISSAEKFVCSDSAPMHIAVGVKTKTYAIFGPTDYKKLIPDDELITPVLAKDSCQNKPCLWTKRKTTCETCDCLDINMQQLALMINKND